MFFFFIIIAASNFLECRVNFVGLCRRDLWKWQH